MRVNKKVFRNIDFDNHEQKHVVVFLGLGDRRIGHSSHDYKYLTDTGAVVHIFDYPVFKKDRGYLNGENLVRSATAIVRDLLDQGIKLDNIKLMGNSLGAGIIAQVYDRFKKENIRFRSIITNSFDSLAKTAKANPIWSLIYKFTKNSNFESGKIVEDAGGDIIYFNQRNDSVIPPQFQLVTGICHGKNQEEINKIKSQSIMEVDKRKVNQELKLAIEMIHDAVLEVEMKNENNIFTKVIGKFGMINLFTKDKINDLITKELKGEARNIMDSNIVDMEKCITVVAQAIGKPNKPRFSSMTSNEKLEFIKSELKNSYDFPKNICPIFQNIHVAPLEYMKRTSDGKAITELVSKHVDLSQDKSLTDSYDPCKKLNENFDLNKFKETSLYEDSQDFSVKTPLNFEQKFDKILPKRGSYDLENARNNSSIPTELSEVDISQPILTKFKSLGRS